MKENNIFNTDYSHVSVGDESVPYFDVFPLLQTLLKFMWNSVRKGTKNLNGLIRTGVTGIHSLYQNLSPPIVARYMNYKVLCNFIIICFILI